MTQWRTLFDGQLAVQPPLDDAALSGVPAKRGVVLLTAQDDRPIIMLSAADIRARTAARLRNPQEDQRHKTPDLREITRTIYWKLSAGHFETDLHFLEIARAIWPTTYPSLLSWKPAWFVHVNPQETFPHFVRTADVFESSGRYVGPFESGTSADRFIEAVQDAFDLCRDYRCLRMAPNGPRCSYGQMGRCACPCDGTIPMDQYRQIVARAADFAVGNRQEFRRDLQQRMSQSAAALEFEKAAALKNRLERLAVFDKTEYHYVAPAEEFRFLLVQSGGSTRKARAFLSDRGQISPAVELGYPLQKPQVQAMLERFGAQVQATGQSPASTSDDMALPRLRMGLINHYLFSSPQRRGLILRWTPSLDTDALIQSIEQATEQLRLKRPSR